MTTCKPSLPNGLSPGLVLGGFLARFSLVGATNTILHIAITAVLAFGLGFSRMLAWWIAFSCVTVFSYFAHRRFSFRSQRQHRSTILPFMLVVMISQLMGSWIYLHAPWFTASGLGVLPRWLGDLATLVMAAGITATLSFFGLAWVFKGAPGKEPK